jgi:hypothetical protein
VAKKGRGSQITKMAGLPSPPQRVYRLKITLDYIQPPIWRCFQVPASITLDQLHAVVQVVMGWESDHLFGFAKGEMRYEPKRQNQLATLLGAQGK